MPGAVFSLSCGLVLASTSPRRQQVVSQWGVPFSIDAPDGEEPSPRIGESPEEYALKSAYAKGAGVARRHPGKAVIGADTIVTADGEILRKPLHADTALAMLKSLAGRTHSVITAVSVFLPDGSEEVFSDRADVTFYAWPEEVLAAYVRTGEPLDKAGAYAIQGQGAFLAERIEGSWSTVVGLPVSMTAALLVRRGVLLPA